MAEDRSHDIETDAERARLRALVTRLSDADLGSTSMTIERLLG